MLEHDGFEDISAVLHCVVYALVLNGEVVYIGQSKKPLQRIAKHMDGRNVKAAMGPFGAPTVKRIKFDDVWIRPCMLGELDDVEREMIKKYKPRYNIVHKDQPLPAHIKHLVLMLSARPELPASRDVPERRYMIRRL